MWMMAAQAGMSALSAYMNKGKEAAQAMLEQAKADSANAMRAGQNTLAAAQAALATHGRTSANVDRALASAAKRSELLTAAAGKVDQLATGDLQQQAEAAMAIGAATAAHGAAGVAGSMSSIRQTAMLQSAMSTAAAERAQERVAGGVNDAIGTLAVEERAGVDLTQTYAAINQMQTYAPMREKTSILGAALQGAAGQAGATAKAGGGGLTGLANTFKTDINQLTQFFSGGKGGG